MADVEVSKAVQEATGTDWRGAVSAAKDAEKLLLAAKRGVPTSKVIVARAIQLIQDEPHRRPENIAAIEALKKELKLPIAQVREVMVAEGYDVAKARARLETLSVERAAMPKPLKKSKEYRRRAVRGVMRGDTLLVELRREKILSKAEQREQKALLRNGEVVGNPWDRRLVCHRKGEWSRLPLHTDERFGAVGLLADGTWAIAAPRVFPPPGRKRPCTEVFFEGRDPLVRDEQRFTAAVGTAKVVLFRGRGKGDGELWRVGSDGEWTELAVPDSTDRLRTVSATGADLWLGSRLELLRGGGGEWTSVELRAPSEDWKRGNRPFGRVVIGPSGKVAAISDRLWVGTPDTLEEASMAGAQKVAFVGERVAFTWKGTLFLRGEDGTNHRIREPEKRGKRLIPPIWFTSETDLYAIDGECIERWDGDRWEPTEYLHDAWKLVDALEPAWVAEPRWLPR